MALPTGSFVGPGKETTRTTWQGGARAARRSLSAEALHRSLLSTDWCPRPVQCVADMAGRDSREEAKLLRIV